MPNDSVFDNTATDWVLSASLKRVKNNKGIEMKSEERMGFVITIAKLQVVNFCKNQDQITMNTLRINER